MKAYVVISEDEYRHFWFHGVRLTLEAARKLVPVATAVEDEPSDPDAIESYSGRKNDGFNTPSETLNRDWFHIFEAEVPA